MRGVLCQLGLDRGELRVQVLHVRSGQVLKLLFDAVDPAGERLDVGIVGLAALEKRGALVFQRDERREHLRGAGVVGQSGIAHHPPRGDG